MVFWPAAGLPVCSGDTDLAASCRGDLAIRRAGGRGVGALHRVHTGKERGRVEAAAQVDADGNIGAKSQGDAVAHQCDVFVGDLLQQNEPFGSQADLTGVMETPPDARFNGLRDVRVFTDDKGIRSPQFHHGLFNNFPSL